MRAHPEALPQAVAQAGGEAAGPAGVGVAVAAGRRVPRRAEHCGDGAEGARVAADVRPRRRLLRGDLRREGELDRLKPFTMTIIALQTLPKPEIDNITKKCLK